MIRNGKIAFILTGIAASVMLAACTGMDRMHDTRMRMRDASMTGPNSGSNYGTMSVSGGGASSCPMSGAPASRPKIGTDANKCGMMNKTDCPKTGTDANKCSMMNMADCPKTGTSANKCNMANRAHCPKTGTDANKCGMMSGAMPKSAVATLVAASGSAVSGWVKFTKTEKGIELEANVNGLTPGLHGFHIHEFGDASAADGMSAGGHFNPCQTAHGGPTSDTRHVGDLGNLDADATGHASLKWTDPLLSFHGPKSIIGRSVVIHAKPDDLTSQPVGNAGARIAVGVIGVTKSAQ